MIDRLAILISCGTIVLAGCGQSDPPVFRLNMAEMVARQTEPEYQAAIANVLDAMFGTPDEPYVLPETDLDLRLVKLAAGPVWSDEQGTGHGLYRQHCAHCHGIRGDGHGPTALFLNPYPRDYRQGVFKFKSTFNPAQPTDEDLHRVIMNGVPGTAMPSFSLLPPTEVDALVEYVKYLSIRGQMETALVNYVFDELGEEDGKLIPLDPASDPQQREVIVNELLADIVSRWKESEDSVIVPEDAELPAEDRSPEQIAQSVEKGRELFYGTRANCIKCHGPTGLGDGQQDDHNIWNKSVVEFHQRTEELAEKVGAGRPEDVSDQQWEATKQELRRRRHVLATMFPPRNAIPRNLRQGMYRGGQRPLDIFRKVYTGIAGTPMPGLGPAMPGAQGTLSEEEMWHLVDYVRSLPFEPASTPQKLRINYDVLN